MNGETLIAELNSRISAARWLDQLDSEQLAILEHGSTSEVKEILEDLSERCGINCDDLLNALI